MNFLLSHPTGGPRALGMQRVQFESRPLRHLVI